MNEMDENGDDAGASCTLEYFAELDTIVEMIVKLRVEHTTTFEKSYEEYSRILSRYQEQPHLLNPHLPQLIELLLAYIRENSNSLLTHSAFKYMYQLAKVRMYKVLVKFLPHEIADLDFVLNALEQQQVDDSSNWETRYMLLLWLSILVLNPFEMARFDAHATSNDDASTKMNRIFELCKLHTQRNDTCAMVAAFLTAKYLIRIDIKDRYLPKYFDWVISVGDGVPYGQLAAVASVLKHGKREDLLPHAAKFLQWLLASDNYKTENDYLKKKYFIKIVQRLGLVFLRPQLALWRYQRGSRSLTVNLKMTSHEGSGDGVEFENTSLTANEDDVDDEVPAEVEEVIEELLQALRNPSSDIRWSAAKGIGRVTSRLPKDFGDEVVGSVIEILNPLEANEGWHGACLAIAELAKRGLLLPYRLDTLVPLLLQALTYDELKGYMSVGQHIRDAACYMCWAFARAYEPDVLKPFVSKIAAGLLVTTVYDREINCRRAASAAFQESVGRLRTFPHGIDILTKADFFSVGMRNHSYLDISDYVAQYNDYSFPLIDHLVERKVGHWDTAIRELTAKTLHKLTDREPAYVVTDVMPKLFAKTESIDVNQRHGAVLAIGEIVSMLKQLEIFEENRYIDDNLMVQLNDLVAMFQKRDQFKGLSGEMMFQSCCDFIRNCSAAKLPVNADCIQSWQSILDACLKKNSNPIREAAIVALRELCVAYYISAERAASNALLLQSYLTDSREDLWEFVRMGHVSAIGVLPSSILQPNLREVLFTLMAHSLTPAERRKFFVGANELRNEGATVENWAEARRDSVKALINVVQTVSYEHIAALEPFDGHDTMLDRIFQCLFNALQEYTVDNRGDIGAWVRESSMNALFKLVTTMPHDMLDATKVHAVVTGLVQQSVEKIDRTRALAGKLFCSLIFHEPIIPHIKDHEFIKTVFPVDYSNVLWLHAAHTFPLFCSLLELPDYAESLIVGLIASIGQLTESLIKHSSAAMIHFLRNHSEHQSRICHSIVDIYGNNILNERITCPLLNFLNIIISSGCIDSIVLNPENDFSAEIYRLTKLEIKGHRKFYKLISSINVFCQLIQVPALSKLVLSTLSIFLGLQHVGVRKTTATKLYEALILHADVCDIDEENLDEILNILSDTDWGQSIDECRILRNNLCNLLGIKAPIAKAKK